MPPQHLKMLGQLFGATQMGIRILKVLLLVIAGFYLLILIFLFREVVRNGESGRRTLIHDRD